MGIDKIHLRIPHIQFIAADTVIWGGITGVITDQTDLINFVKDNIAELVDEIIGGIITDVSTIKDDVVNIKSEITDIHSTLTNIDNSIIDINGAIDILNTAIDSINSEIDAIKQDLAKREHFRGYFKTNAEIQLITNVEKGDFAWSAETSTVWQFNGTDWVDTLVPVPDQVVPASDLIPLMDGTAESGTSTSYSRGDHRHPTDITRASVSDLTTLAGRVTVNEGNISDNTDEIDLLKTKTDTTNNDLTTLSGRVTVNEGNISNNAGEIDLLKTKTDTTNTDLTTLSGRVTANEANISNNSVEIDLLKTKTDTTNNDLTDLAGRVTVNEGNISDNADDIILLNTKIDTTNTDLTDLAGRVTVNEDNISDNANEIDLLKTKTDTTNSDLTTLAGRVTINETNISSNANDIYLLKTKTDATNSDLTYLTSRVTINEYNISNNSGEIDLLKTKTDTTNSDLTTLAGRVTVNEGNISNNAGEITVIKSDFATKVYVDTGLSGKVDQVHAGTNVSINGTSTNPIISVTGIQFPQKFTSTDIASGIIGDVITGLDLNNVTAIIDGASFDIDSIVIFSNSIQGQVTNIDTVLNTYDIVIVQIPESTSWGSIGGVLSNQTDLQNALNLKANSSDLASVATSGEYSDLLNKPYIPSKTSDITNDSGFITTTDIPTSLSSFTDDVGFALKSELTQSDWNNSDTSSYAYIKNKPTNVSSFNNDSGFITAASIPSSLSSFTDDVGFALKSELTQSDWNNSDTSSYAYIKNKPTNVSSFINDSGFITDSALTPVNEEITSLWVKANNAYNNSVNNATDITNITTRVENNELDIVNLKLIDHFRGYFNTNAEIQLITNVSEGDFAWSAESGTVWQFDGTNWIDTLVSIPDQVVPASDSLPLMNGTAEAGTSTNYARGDHRHPTDTTRASVADLTTLSGRVTVNEGNISNNVYEIDLLKTKTDTTNSDLTTLADRVTVTENDKANKSDLAAVATSGEYTDLLNVPEKIHRTVVLESEAWALDSTSQRYRYPIIDTSIIDGSLVVSSYDNDNYEIIFEAILLQAVSAIGSITYWAVNQPTGNITITYTIL